MKLACRQIFSFGYQSLLPSKTEVVGDWPLTHISPLELVNSWEMPNCCVLKYAYKVKTGTTKLPYVFTVHITTQYYYLYWLQDVFFSPFILYPEGCFWMGDKGGAEVVWYVFLSLKFCGEPPHTHCTPLPISVLPYLKKLLRKIK